MTTFSRIIERYGDGAVLYTAEGAVSGCKCFIQPVMPRSAEKVYSEMTALGMGDKAGYYGYFPENAEMEKCGWVICDGVAYDVMRAEKFKVNGKTSHWETVLKKREDAYCD